ncbi:FIG00785302: hypothetical protein [hydrothermal vent metagenome]|uniref:Hydrazine synthase alpha subunit middle domain-containing protein n=1 Tax=hydrothermal vent metagenome TaxID=652676 RepID=A0A3B0ZC15_9ZZZZ
MVILSGCVDDSQSPDTVLEDHSIAYVKRALYDNEGDLVPLDGRLLLTFRPGGDLYLRDRASATAPERNITASLTQGEGDVRDLSISFDGTKMLFSMRAPELEDVPDDQQPTWNIWEYDTVTPQLKRIITSDVIAKQGQDLSPAYLPNGRIVFTSTRQREAKRQLLDEGKPQFTGIEESLQEHAAVLHVMDADGTDIQQISFNASHDLDPTVLMNGRILFSRWDNMGRQNAIRLYTIRPDGTDLQIHYGAHSAEVGHGNTRTDYIQVQQMEDGKLLATQVARGQNNRGGDLVVIDAENYIDYNQPTDINRGVLSGSGQWDATVLNVQLGDQSLSEEGMFLSAYPLWDGSQRILVSWSPCQVMNDGRVIPCSTADLSSENTIPADPFFGLYLYDTGEHTLRPLVLAEEGVVISDVVALRNRQLPTILFDGIPGDGRIDRDLYDQGVGLLHIRSVYDVDGVDRATPNIATLADPQQTAAASRPARFVKIVKSVALPDQDTLDIDRTALGINRQQRMREIAGYAMVEPDGSVLVEVPANIPFTISLLDANGRRTHNRHQMWLQLRPGETRQCNGCHNHNSGTSHGRVDGPVAINSGAITSGLPFPNTEPGMIANMSETMAQTRGRLSCDTDCAARKLQMDIEFIDHWSDPALRIPDASFEYRYTDLDSTLLHPASDNCQNQWQPLCRGIINYPDHIHPLWDLARVDTALIDRRCTRCHSDSDELGALRVPEAQLQLDGGASPEEATHLISYRELLAADDLQELQNGALQDVLIDSGLFETDEDGELILDGEGNPIPILITQPAPGPSMSPEGANRSYFLSLFEIGGVHEEWMTPSELRLISEWLDVGAQYYNNPFVAPLEE